MKTWSFETNTTVTDPEELISIFFKTYSDSYDAEAEKRIRDAWNFLNM